MLLKVSLSKAPWTPAFLRGLTSTLERSPDQAAWNQYTMSAWLRSIDSKQCVPLHWLEPSGNKTCRPALSSAVSSYCLGKVAQRSWLKMKCLREDPRQPQIMVSEIGFPQAAETGAEQALRRTPFLEPHQLQSWWKACSFCVVLRPRGLRHFPLGACQHLVRTHSWRGPRARSTESLREENLFCRAGLSSFFLCLPSIFLLFSPFPS